MRVLHIIGGISRSSGGPSRSVQGLVAGLNHVGIDAWLMTIIYGEEPWVEGVSHFINGQPIENALNEVNPDIVHLHGLWSFALHTSASICRRWNIPYVIAPRGMLETWSLRQKWIKKKIAWWMFQCRDLRCAAALHATADSEADQFRRLGFRNPVIVSPNGVNTPEYGVATKHKNDTKRVLFVSRMHPKKGVLELVEAWGKVNPAGWECDLVYTVNGDFERNYESKVKVKVKELGLEDQFVFIGALDDERKWKAYEVADLFVLPTYSENFGIVVAEALYAGVPVITTRGTPWEELEARKCGFWIDIGVGPLAVALRKSMILSDDERRDMGARGRKLIKEKYIWDAVVQRMVKGYEGILSSNVRTQQ